MQLPCFNETCNSAASPSRAMQPDWKFRHFLYQTTTGRRGRCSVVRISSRSIATCVPSAPRINGANQAIGRTEFCTGVCTLEPPVLIRPAQPGAKTTVFETGALGAICGIRETFGVIRCQGITLVPDIGGLAVLHGFYWVLKVSSYYE